MWDCGVKYEHEIYMVVSYTLIKGVVVLKTFFFYKNQLL